jgi:multidrug efflux pump subunit AcrB
VLIKAVGTEFVPQTDNGFTQLSVRLPVGSSLQRGSEKIAQVEEAVRKVPGIATISTTVGGTGSGFLVGRNQATLNISLKPRKERDLDQKAIEQALRKAIAQIPGIEASVGTERPIYVTLLGSDPKQLVEQTLAFAKKMEAIPGITDIDASAKPGLPTFAVRLDRIAMRELGLNSNQLASSLRAFVNGEVASYWTASDGEQVEVLLRLPSESRERIEQIRELPIAFSKEGKAIPLSRIASVDSVDNPEVIRRQNLLRREAIFAGVQNRPAGDVGADVQKLVQQTQLPEGMRCWWRDQGATRGLRCHAWRDGPCDYFHLHRSSESVWQLDSAFRNHGLTAAFADRCGVGASVVWFNAQCVFNDRSDHAHGAGDQKCNFAR